MGSTEKEIAAIVTGMLVQLVMGGRAMNENCCWHYNPQGLSSLIQSEVLHPYSVATETAAHAHLLAMVTIKRELDFLSTLLSGPEVGL